MSSAPHAFLRTELPIIQAPMAGSQDSKLAIAVNSAGGLGSLPCAMLSVDAMREHLAAMRAAGMSAQNVNFFCHTQPAPDAEREARWRAALEPCYSGLGLTMENIPAAPARAPFAQAQLEVLAEFRPSIVSFHFGLPPAELLAGVKALGARVMSSATTVAEARWLEARGVDAIIAQGLEAGGHRGIFLSDDLTTQVSTMALLPQIVRAVGVPVIAAGGIADSRGVTAALKLGAAAVQVGTSYLLCPESLTSAVHRAALVGPDREHTALTNLFTGRPARGIVNQFMRELGCLSATAPAFPLATTAMAPLRQRAEKEGSGAYSPLWSGQNNSGCKAIPAAQLTRELMAH